MTKSDLDRADADGFRVAVIGSGPSGFYATEALLRSGTLLAVDMFEQLPVPYGLVRFGVAPDHPKLKLVTTAFDRIATAPGFRFIGGVAVGRDVSIDELRDCYDAVVLATGAARPGDMILTLGAGSISQLAQQVLTQLTASTSRLAQQGGS